MPDLSQKPLAMPIKPAIDEEAMIDARIDRQQRVIDRWQRRIDRMEERKGRFQEAVTQLQTRKAEVVALKAKGPADDVLR